MDDYGGNRGANVMIRVHPMPRQAEHQPGHGQPGRGVAARRAAAVIPTSGPSRTCDCKPIAIVVGASNTWFAQTLSTLAVPATGASELQTKVAQLWEPCNTCRDRRYSTHSGRCPSSRSCTSGARHEVCDAIEQHAKAAEAGVATSEKEYPDLLTPEWEIFTATPPPEPTDDFALRRGGVPGPLAAFVSDVVQAERLREVRALTGFTRLDAPDPQDPDLVKRAPLARDKPTWVPASEVRGRRHLPARRRLRAYRMGVPVADSEVVPRAQGGVRAVPHQPVLRAHQGRLRCHVRLAGRPVYRAAHPVPPADQDDRAGMRVQLGEPVRADLLRPGPRGILIYTAVPDAEGTLGGLVSLAEPEPLTRIMERALRDARALLIRPAMCRAAAGVARRLPARRGLSRMPVRLRDRLRARQPVPRPPVHRPDRPRVPRAHPVTWDEPLEKAAADLLRTRGPAALRAVVEHAMEGRPREAILRAAPYSAPLLDALADVDRSAGLAYLTGLAAGYAQRAAEVSVETVWSGPGSYHVPVRATAAVLADVIREARRELLLMTYSARQYQPLTAALQAAVSQRRATCSVVVETLQGAGSALPETSPTRRSSASAASTCGTGLPRSAPNLARRCTPSSRSPTGASSSSPAPTSPSPASARTSRLACSARRGGTAPPVPPTLDALRAAAAPLPA